MNKGTWPGIFRGSYGVQWDCSRVGEVAELARRQTMPMYAPTQAT